MAAQMTILPTLTGKPDTAKINFKPAPPGPKSADTRMKIETIVEELLVAVTRKDKRLVRCDAAQLYLDSVLPISMEQKAEKKVEMAAIEDLRNKLNAQLPLSDRERDYLLLLENHLPRLMDDLKKPYGM